MMNNIFSKGFKLRSTQFSALAIISLISGFLLMLNNIGILTGIWKLWPIFPFFLGIGGIWYFKRGAKRDVKTLGIGLFLFLVSIFFLILNYTRWSLLANLWPVFIGIFGISLLAASYFSDKRRWFALSGLFFIFLAILLYVVFTVDAKLWPTSLIMFGVWLLFIPERNKNEENRCNS